MSFRELRNFCEIMRGLGFPRLISVENFRRPNFELVAEILYWLAQRYDPSANLSDNIDEERNRVEYIKQICTLFLTKARLKLNPPKLYRADGYAVQELLKIATMLHKAYYLEQNDNDEQSDFSLPSRLSNLKSIKSATTDITEVGARVFDLLGKENELRQHRDKATQFLDNINRNLESNNEQQYIENCVKEIINQQNESIQEMQKYVQNLEKDEKTLEEKIKKKQLDLERSEQRLKSITNVKPAYMEEYERLERDLEKLYGVYMDKIRNLEYLEHQLDVYNSEEQEKFEENQQALRKMQQKIKEEEMRVLRGDAEIDQDQFDEQLEQEGFNRTQDNLTKPSSSQMAKRSDMKMNQKGMMHAPIESENEDSEEDEDEDSDEVSIGQDENEDDPENMQQESDNEF